MDWTALFSAIALVLVFEGLLPFISPESARQVFAKLAMTPQKQLRLTGLGSIILGLLLLSLTR